MISKVPTSPELADGAAEWAGCYVHVPFCASICPYCDFAVVAGRDEEIPSYLETVVKEIELEPEWRSLDAVFIGGGTPSRAGASGIATILAALQQRFGLAPDAEISLEANPEDVTPELAEGLLAAGCNRLSLGAQSFDMAVLGSLGRSHSPETVDEAVRSARDAGFASISVDLIFGTPGETEMSWSASVDRVIEADVDHVSTYALTVERGTPLSRSIIAGAPAPDPDDQATKDEIAAAKLGAARFSRYEVSNYARDGHACRYNLTAWAQGEYVAFGNGAHRHLGRTRSWNHRRLEAYMTEVASGAMSRNGETLADWERSQERLMIGIRRSAGAPMDGFATAFVQSPHARRLIDAGVLAVDSDRLRCVPLMADKAGRAVLDFQAGQ